MRGLGGASLMVKRRQVIALPALAAVLAACTNRSSSAASARLIESGESAQSPSGSFTAELAETGDTLTPRIVDAGGAEVWADDLPHVPRYAPGVLWETDADVLWILSTDHGNAKVSQGSDGAWVKTMTSDGMPEDIAEIAR